MIESNLFLKLSFLRFNTPNPACKSLTNSLNLRGVAKSAIVTALTASLEKSLIIEINECRYSSVVSSILPATDSSLGPRPRRVAASCLVIRRPVRSQ